MWAIWVANEWPWIPSGLFRKLRALSIARPKRARQATSRSWTSGEIRTSATSSNTSGVTVRRPTSVLPARAPSITWSDRSSVKTSESKRGLVMTSVRRSSTLSSTAVSAIAVPRWPISSLNRNFSSWSSIPRWYTGGWRARSVPGDVRQRLGRVRRRARPVPAGQPAPAGSACAVAQAAIDVRRHACDPGIGRRDATLVCVLPERVEGPGPLVGACGYHGAARRRRVDGRRVRRRVARRVLLACRRHGGALRPELGPGRRDLGIEGVVLLSHEAHEAVSIADARPRVEPVARVDHDPVRRRENHVAVHLADHERLGPVDGRQPPLARRQLGVRRGDRVGRLRLVADDPAARPQRRRLEADLPVDRVRAEERGARAGRQGGLERVAHRRRPVLVVPGQDQEAMASHDLRVHLEVEVRAVRDVVAVALLPADERRLPAREVARAAGFAVRAVEADLVGALPRGAAVRARGKR